MCALGLYDVICLKADVMCELPTPPSQVGRLSHLNICCYVGEVLPFNFYQVLEGGYSCPS